MHIWFKPEQRVIVKSPRWEDPCPLFATDPSLNEPPIRKGKIVRMAAVPHYWWVKLDDVPGETIRPDSEIEPDNRV